MVRRLAATVPGHCWLPARSPARGSLRGEGGPSQRRQRLCPSGRRAGAEPRRGGNSKASGGGW